MHYVIVGNGVAGVTAAFTLRQRDGRARITLVSGESDYFFSRTALMYAYMDELTLRDMEPHERQVYDKQRIERRRGWVKSIAGGVLTFTDGSTLAYDKLLLAVGSEPNPGPWPKLEGVVHFVSLQDLAECQRLTPATRRAVVVGGGLIGVELVECLLHHGVEVDFVIREASYWPIALAADEGRMVIEHMERRGVRVRLGEEIVEVLGAGRVSGVRTSKGETIDCQLLGVCVGVRPCVGWLQGVAVGRGIQVSSSFQTSIENVWAAGDCAELPGGLVEQIWYSAKRQGELAARAMLGDAIDYEPPLFYNSAKFFGIEYTTVGRPLAGEAFSFRFPDREATVRISTENGAVIGFNMLGARWDHAWFERWIRERWTFSDCLNELHKAQFDGEFGRLPLKYMYDAYKSKG